jgi:2-polyprenyl-3-methyl-5-hydroxy-6-metoxy-1,4-benzoquinol methylase
MFAAMKAIAAPSIKIGKIRLMLSFGTEPTLEQPTSQLCTASQFSGDIYRRWCAALAITGNNLHRKNWELVYICRVAEYLGLLKPGNRALGFGVGREPISSLLASKGLEVTATDAPEKKWESGNQYATDLKAIWNTAIVPWNTFAHNVTLRRVDMNRIPADLREYDFVWSSCSLEHIGGLRPGLEFIKNSMACLRRGGIGVHTTEFNLSSNNRTFESSDLSLYRRRDIDGLVKELRSLGHSVWDVNYFPGRGKIDRHIDLPPYSLPHVKLSIFGFACTSIGIIVRKSDDAT